MGESGNPQAAMVMIMSRFFFNVLLENHLLPDPEGQELPDPDAAWEREYANPWGTGSRSR